MFNKRESDLTGNCKLTSSRTMWLLKMGQIKRDLYFEIDYMLESIEIKTLFLFYMYCLLHKKKGSHPHCALVKNNYETFNNCGTF